MSLQRKEKEGEDTLPVLEEDRRRRLQLVRHLVRRRLRGPHTRRPQFGDAAFSNCRAVRTATSAPSMDTHDAPAPVKLQPSTSSPPRSAATAPGGHHRQRHVRRGRLAERRAVYGFLFSGFREDRWWFELWNTLRKSLFTMGGVVFGPFGTSMQTWAALVLLPGSPSSWQATSTQLPS